MEGIGEKGLVLRGWVPQVAILRHPAIGGFLTHCGWNSCLEGITAGLPMITWPQFSEQFVNERFLVDVLKIGVSVGAKVCSGSEEKRTLVKAEEVTKAVNEVMGDGEEAEERRKRAKGLAAMAREAMEEGGSSYAEMSRLILELRDLKKVRELGLESKDEGDV
ncbi:UDP-glycosyltransferase 73E1-like [Asparagus officinalis]|uniref:UDP-glycosyltransferase 73E1-like n=1 Tax=Asparagus officinalis TaxID=4686 RepID=UPI00098E7B28|nr:UDP-glycosyltransferase 73E1-like [Asparagus officinalis]